MNYKRVQILSLATFCIAMLYLIGCSNDDDNSTSMSNKHQATPYQLQQPDGFPIMNIPSDNPMTVEGIALGRQLFYDPILSKDSTISCASCHLQSSAFTDDLAISVGVENLVGTRSSMALMNIGYADAFNWDGSKTTLEEQALGPIETGHELGNNKTEVVAALKSHDNYPSLFKAAFGSNTITIDRVLKALAQFERTLISANSKYDKVVLQEGNFEFFTTEEQNGFDMFFDHFAGINDLPDAECGHCHNAPLFTTADFFNNGIQDAPTLNDFTDNGRGGATSNVNLNGQFKAPSLRNITLTAPYMHDGRFNTLEEVLDHYSSGGHYSPNKDPLVYATNLSEQNKKDIIAFLHTLTDNSFTKNAAFSNPFK